MKRIPTLLISFFVAAVSACPSQAQETPDDSEFRALHNPVISADGAWMAAEEHPGRGDGNVRVRSTEGDKTFTIERGQNPRISRDSRWVSALQKPPLEDSRTAKPKDKRAGQTLVLLDTQDGSRRTFDFVLSYDMTKSSSTGSPYLLYLQSPETKADEEGHSRDEATKPAARERTVGTLHSVHLESGNVVFTMENVAQYATHQTTRRVAFVLHDEETGRDTLHIAGFSARNWGMNQKNYDGEKIEGLCWARDRLTLGFLDSTEITGNDGKRRVNSALYTWQLGQPAEDKFTRVDRGDSEFGALHNPVISADGAWIAAEKRSDRGDGNVRVWSTEGKVTFTIERGHSPRISRDGRWVSALQEPPLEDSVIARPKNKRAGQTLVLLDTQDGSTRTIDFVLSYDMTYCSLYLLYLQSPETKADEEGHSKEEATKPAKKPAAKERTVGTLHLVHLKSDYRVLTMESVAQYVAHQTMNYVAYVLHDEETGRDTLHIVGFSPRNLGMNGIYDGEKIEGLCWARDRRMFGFLDSTETNGNDGKRRANSALYTWQRDIDNPSWGTIFTRVDTPQ